MDDLEWLHDPDKNYVVRVCMLTTDSIWVVPESVVKQCRGCGRDIWFDTRQATPPHPEGLPYDGEVLLCMDCTAVHAAHDDEPMNWLDQDSI